MQLGVRGGGGDFPAMLGSRRFHSVTELAEALRVCPPLRACQLQAADGSSLCAQALLDRAMHGSHPAAVADGSPVRLLQVAQAPVPAPMLARQTQVDVRAQRVPETSAGAPAVQPTTVAAARTLPRVAAPADGNVQHLQLAQAQVPALQAQGAVRMHDVEPQYKGKLYAVAYGREGFGFFDDWDSCGVVGFSAVTRRLTADINTFYLALRLANLQFRSHLRHLGYRDILGFACRASGEDMPYSRYKSSSTVR